MYIAQKLRKKNIVAYVLYLFQVEDVIRAYGLDVDRIVEEYLPRFDYDDAQLEEVAEWYSGLIDMMNMEMCQQVGHVQVVTNAIMMMEERHQELMEDPESPFYGAAYYKALPFLTELRAKGMGEESGDVQNCLDAIYGTTLLKMQGKKISPETAAAIQPITHLMELLAENFEE